MKKLFVLLLALTMVVGAVSAQVAITGWAHNSVVITEDGATYSDLMRLNLSWKSEDGTLMFGSRLQGTSGNMMDIGVPADVSANNDLDVKYLYGRATLAGGKVIVDIGRLSNWTYDVCSGISDWYLGNVENYVSSFVFAYENGMSVELLPLEGLRFGFVFAPDTDISLGDFGAGFKYAIADVGTAIVTARFDDTAEDSELNALFTYSGVDMLTATIGYKGLAAHSVYGIFNYEMDALTINLAPMYEITAENLYAELSVLYGFGDMFDVIGLFSYDQNQNVVDDEIMFGAEFRIKTGGGYLGIVPQYGDVNGFSLSLDVSVFF